MLKKIRKWEPDDFELEMTTHWSFPKRGDWATHDAKWRGNWSPYIPRNIILRYSQEEDLILDQFAGGGTTLVEAKLLNRDIIGVDINDVALERCKEKTAFDIESAKGKVYIKKGDARNLDLPERESHRRSRRRILPSSWFRIRLRPQNRFPSSGNALR